MDIFLKNNGFTPAPNKLNFLRLFSYQIKEKVQETFNDDMAASPKTVRRKLVMVRGFTLIELLVVIAVIGILASATMISFPTVSKKSRDSQRLQDAHQIFTAIKVYKEMTGVFPESTVDECCSDWDQSPCNGDKTFITDLVIAGAVSVLPTDPLKNTVGDGCYGYNYFLFPAGTFGCDADRGKFFVFGIRDLEAWDVAQDGVFNDSSGFNCSGYNFQDDFDWVVGGFEK